MQYIGALFSIGYMIQLAYGLIVEYAFPVALAVGAIIALIALVKTDGQLGSGETNLLRVVAAGLAGSAAVLVFIR